MKSTLLALATIAILAQQAQAKASTPIDGCLETFKVPDASIEPNQLNYAKGGCFLLADQYKVTFEDLLAWNKDLRRDCLNLDVGNDICVKGPMKGAPEAKQSTPIQPQANTTPEMSKPQAVTTTTTNPAMADTKAKPQAASSTNANKPLAQSTRPLYPNMAKAVKQSPKAMVSGPKGESVQSKVPSGTNEAQSYD
ncbi:hypothetical protein CPB97_011250 [Podila verticillata]|nr:hypothetical protein CPB97_011250 [Podila verticillata]